MIFVTVGTQLPFDRLIDAVDVFAAAHPNEEIVAQTGEQVSADRWPHLTLVQHLSPEDFVARVQAARLIVAHAGIGTILTAKQYHRPLVLVPRSHAMGEHRNDHQMATAREMEGRLDLYVCVNLSELGNFMARDDLVAPNGDMAPQASNLIAYLSAAIR